MFKAKFIEDQSYYQLKSKRQKLTTIILFIPSFVLIFIYESYWLAIPIFIGLAIMIFFISKNKTRIDAMFGDKLIEIDEQEIRIKTKKGTEAKRIDLDKVDKLLVKEYAMPPDNMKSSKEEMLGIVKEHFLMIQQNNKTKRFDFEIESYFMVDQLKGVIEKWKNKGYQVELID